MISHLHLGIERQSIIEKHYDSRKLRLISDFFLNYYLYDFNQENYNLSKKQYYQ